MNIYTFKLTKKTFGIIAAALLLIVGLIIALCSCGRGDTAKTSGKLSELPTAKSTVCARW